MNDDIKEILKDSLYNGLTDENYKLLLDYITNLQEEMEKIRSDYIGEKLKNDKAIEYIEKNNIYVENDTLRTGKWELLYILRGETNE